jgi:hypothetical protein
VYAGVQPKTKKRTPNLGIFLSKNYTPS